MGYFTRIPETNLAGALGIIVGKSAGTVVSSTNLAVEKLQTKLDILCERASSGDRTAYDELMKIEHTIDTLERAITTVETVLEGVNTIATAIAIPIAAAKIAIDVVKYMPLPQIWLITSVSALQADLIQMLSELVAQIEQIVLTLLVIIKILLELLKKLKAFLEKLRKVIAALKAALALQKDSLSEQDRDILRKLGILDLNGNNIFNRLASSINGRLTDIIWLGDYEMINTGSLAVENQVKAAESGTTIDVPVETVGNWVTTVYTISETKPDKPTSRELIPPGWSSKVKYEKGKTWSSKGTVSGLTSKVLAWTEPITCLFTKEKQSQIKPITQEVNVFRLNAGKFRASKFNMSEANAIILTGSEEAYSMMLGLLQDIDEAPLDPGLKEQLCIEINPQEDQSESENTEEWYISKTTGYKYLMTLKASSVSPKIATLRYIEVTDESGVIVYEGSQTFATDPRVLFEETRVRLTQLLG